MYIEQARVEAYDALVASIYNSIDCDQPWSEPLELLRSLLKANVACIRISQKGSIPRQHLFAAGPKVSAEAIDEWQSFNARELLPIDMAVGEAQNLNWRHIGSSGAMGAMLDRYEIANMAVMCLDIFDGTQCTLNCSRGFDLPPFEFAELELVKAAGRHLREALRLRRELTRAKIVSQFQTEALDSLGIAAFLITKSGGHFLLNQTAQYTVDNEIGLKLTSNGIHAVDEIDDSAFQTAVRKALQSDDATASRAMLLSRGKSDERLHVIVRPRVHRSFLHDKSEISALVFVRANEIVCRDDVKMLQQLFSFTATEAQLAIGLAKGLCLKDIEAELKIRHNTARAHLRSMFVKADVSRQSQLVSLLTSSLVPLGREAGPSIQ